MKREIVDQNKNEKLIRWIPTEGKTITKKSIKKIYDSLYPNVDTISIRAKFNGVWKTVTTAGKLNLDRIEEYYDNQVLSLDKFTGNITKIEALVSKRA